MSVLKLLFVVIHLGKNSMDAVVEAPDGAKRKVKLTWVSKHQTDCPPDNWFDLVLGEVAYSDAEKIGKSKGRVLFR